jgi:hypothetical protein
VSTNWTQTLFDGLLGGVVGSVGAFSAAVIVSRRQSASDRELAEQQRAADRALAVDNARRQEANSVLIGLTDLKRLLRSPPLYDVSAVDQVVAVVEEFIGEWPGIRARCASISPEVLAAVEAFNVPINVKILGLGTSDKEEVLKSSRDFIFKVSSLIGDAMDAVSRFMADYTSGI